MAEEIQVIGPPGCGKTYDLEHRVIPRAVDRYGADRVVAASFTTGAANNLNRSGLPIPSHHIGTLHALAFRALLQGGYVTGEIADTDDGLKEWNQYCSDSGQRRWTVKADVETKDDRDEPGWDQPNEASEGDAAFNEYQLLRARCVPRDLWRGRTLEFSHLWENWKRETSKIDFTDMIELAIEHCPKMPGDIRVGVFDEVQDFTRLEQRLVRTWGSHMDSYALAGDSDQAIYSWKGADHRVFLDHPTRYRKFLEQSVRVPKAVHAVAEAWINRVQERLQRTYHPRDFEGSVKKVNQTIYDGDALARFAERTVSQGKRIMFITACGYMLGQLKTSLKEAGLPFGNRYRLDDRKGWNPLKPVARGVSTLERILSFLRPDVATFGEDQARWWTNDDVRLWLDPLDATTTLQPRHTKKAASASLKALPPGAGVTWEWLMDWLTPEAIERLVDRDLTWYFQHIISSKRDVFAYPLRVAERRGGAALRTPPMVTIGTIHSVKGGEDDVVVVAPDLSPSGYQEWQGNREQTNAVRRLFFVAMTRPKESLVLLRPAGKQAVDW